MKKIICLIALGFAGGFSVGFSQSENNLRFTYDFSFQRDTNDVNSKTKESFVLDVFRDHSSFVSLNKIKNDKYLDSLVKSVEKAGGINNVTSINLRKLGGIATEAVTYKFPDGKIRYQERISGSRYEYKEEMNPDWKILDSTADYSNYHCQLATTHYGGRDWLAWFTSDIPVSDGPYKFMGLPGLIVKMQDSRGECMYELTEVANHSQGDATVPKAEIVSKSEMKKMWENVRNKSVSANLNTPINGASTNSMIIARTSDGREMTMEEVEKRRQENLKKNNNRIEID